MSRLAHIDSGGVFTAIVFLIVQCVGLSNCNIFCPEQVPSICECHKNTTTTISLRCKNKDLKEYPHFGETKQLIRQLDLSFNQLSSLPNNLDQYSLLETLDLSHNHIEAIANDIRFPVNLRTLSLANNKLSNWLFMRPNTLLQSAINLHTLNLAGNPLSSFSTNDERLLLVSKSLRWLDVSECQITKVGGPLILSGMVNLEHLSLSGNPITAIPDMISPKLFSLDLSRCKIGSLRRTVFSHMPELSTVDLSQNPQLSLSQSNGEFVESESVRHLDVSQCNLNTVELNGMPNLTTVILRNNMIRQLTFKTFEYNTRIENLELSYNSIYYVSTVAFRSLKQLKNIDLSFNMIREIEPYMFSDNPQLTTINLSHNSIVRLHQIHSPSVIYLNLSWCEVSTIDGNALDEMPELCELDLSYNFFSELGNGRLESKLLRALDLTRCRLTTINNNTFDGFPELSRLNLAGNRLTTIFQKDYFHANPFLNYIWLGDNPWICDCRDKEMQEFHRFLTEYPPRVMDRNQLRCSSPRDDYGKLWEVACNDIWYTTDRKSKLLERLWTIAMVVLINVSIIFCAASCFKKWLRYRKETEQEDERLQNLETAREVMAHNQRVLEQEGQLNAPDPRETNPPRYEDAILLPRLDTSFASLRRAGLIGDAYGIEEEIKRAAKRSRCRSEEVLNRRDSSAAAPFTSRMRRHIRAARIRRTHRNCESSLEIPRSNAMSAPEHIRVATPGMASNGSFIFEPIRNFDSVDDGSPYAKRKNAFEMNVAVASTSAALVDANGSNREMVIIENHYMSKTSLAAVEPNESERNDESGTQSISISYATMSSTSSSSSI